MSSRKTQPDPRFFATAQDLRDWFEGHHDRLDEQWIGFYKKDSGIPSITWPESVDQALCFGWIDGLRKSIDDQRYMIRFTPRRPGSHWSARNLARMKRLLPARLVRHPGATVYAKRDQAKEEPASYEQDEVRLPSEYRQRLCDNPAAWSHWQAARPSYRKQVSWWIVSAKREATRLRRLEILIESSAAGNVIPPLRWAARE